MYLANQVYPEDSTDVYNASTFSVGVFITQSTL